jgi:hypothetical protein
MLAGYAGSGGWPRCLCWIAHPAIMVDYAGYHTLLRFLAMLARLIGYAC